MRALDVVIRILNELQENILHVLADVTRFGERRRVRDRKGNIQYLRKRARQQRLSAARGPEQENIGLFQLDVILVRLGVDAFIMVIYADGEHALGIILPDDVLVQPRLNLGGFHELHHFDGIAPLHLLLVEDLFADLDALVADIDAVRPRDQPVCEFLRLPAEGTK